MVKDEIWSIPVQRICAFFRLQENVTEAASSVFLFHSCRITLSELEPNKIGPWEISRTRIRLEGEEADTQSIYSRFFNQFLSAGG